MSVDRSMIRFIVLGAAIVAISTMVVVAGRSWPVFESINGFLGIASAIPNNQGNDPGPDPATPSSPMANGKIYFGDGPIASSNIIAFQPGGDPQGTGTNLGRGYHPAVSPDGNTICFVDNTAGSTNNQIMLMNIDGTNRRALPNPATGFTPTWSSDGSRIAYVVGNFSSGETGSGDIYVMDMPTGANQTKIPNTQNSSSPTWGVNNFIVFYSRVGFPGIAKMGPIPVITSEIATNPPPATVIGADPNDREPSVSPDATKIAFKSFRNYPSFNASEIYTMDLNGGSVTPLTTEQSQKSNPTWAPDGTAIAFDGGSALRSVLSNGSNGTNATTLKFGAARFPNWANGPAILPVDLFMQTMSDDPDPAAKGSNYNYLFTLRNLSSTPATGVRIVFDPIPTNIRVHPIMQNCTMATDRRVTCTFANLAAGATSSPNVTFAADQEGSITIKATVSADEPDPVPSNNFRTETTTIRIPADVGVRFSPRPPVSVGIGSNVTFTAIVYNNGPASASGVVFDGFLDSGFDTPVVTSGVGCTVSGIHITCSLGTVEVGPSGFRTITFTARANAVGIGPVRIFESVDVNNTLDPIPLNGSDSADVAILPVIELIGLEVTQAVQDLANSVPLVADKRTFVRAYVRTPPASTERSISASLVGTNSAGVSNGRLAPSNPGQTVMVLRDPKRNTLIDSFYFELLPDWIKPGTLQFRIESSDVSLTCQEPDSTPNCATTVTFNPAPNLLDVRFYNLAYTVGTTTTKPTSTDLNQVIEELKAIYPTATLLYDTYDWSVPPGVGRPGPIGDFQKINNQLLTQFKLDCRNTPSVCSKYYLGLLANAPNGGTLGLANDIPGDVCTSYIDGNLVVGHELGHDIGLRHTDYNAQRRLSPSEPAFGSHTPSDGTISTGKVMYDPKTVYGFDVNDTGTYLTTKPSRVYGPNTPDLMSYSAQRQWVSENNYGRMLSQLQGITGSDPGNRPVEKEIGETVQANNVVLLSGLIPLGPGTTPEISAVYVLDLPGPLILPPVGTYSVRLEDGTGQSLATYSFEPDQSTEAVELATFNLMLPWEAATKRISILRDGQPIVSRQASANAPTVTVTSPNGGETLGGATTALTWSANDPDGGALSYIVQYSPDGGVTWRVLIPDLTTTTYVLDLSSVAGTTTGLIRVIASDGLNTAQDQSNAFFTVTGHAPQTSISSSSNDAVHVGDQTIIFKGSAYDAEEGLLPNARLAWSSNLNGSLGTGSSLAINAMTLQEGTHTITLTATDSTSRTGTATISIRVFRTRPIFPAELSAGPTGLVFNSTFGPGAIPPQPLAIRNAGDGNLAWTATADQPWIQLASAAGTAPANADVNINQANLPPGNYHGTITIAAGTTPGSPKVINVDLSTIAGPPSNISGRVLSPTGLGLRNAIVSIVSSQGVRRTATTSSFGVFSFAGVADDYYTISISSKRFRFAVRTVQISNDASLTDFVGLE